MHAIHITLRISTVHKKMKCPRCSCTFSASTLVSKIGLAQALEKVFSCRFPHFLFWIQCINNHMQFPPKLIGSNKKVFTPETIILAFKMPDAPRWCSAPQRWRSTHPALVGTQTENDSVRQAQHCAHITQTSLRTHPLICIKDLHVRTAETWAKLLTPNSNRQVLSVGR